MEHLKWGQSELRGDVRVKYTPDFKDLIPKKKESITSIIILYWSYVEIIIFGYIGLKKIYSPVFKCDLAAKESGLESMCVNKDDFTVLVSGGSRCHGTSMCTVWPSHSK